MSVGIKDSMAAPIGNLILSFSYYSSRIQICQVWLMLFCFLVKCREGDISRQSRKNNA
ncbi:hypothetical protein CBFG_03276 [Clostridiales bacterium 1_7_47FAA]|nr:hypothetical protein CBFG_03276 [Clostridiales bacterium 1_7_47FAA]